MPSTTDERRALIVKWFGDIDCAGPEDVLESQGFTVGEDWVIRKPTPSHTMTFEQYELVAFLIQEWDYGWERGPVDAKQRVRS